MEKDENKFATFLRKFWTKGIIKPLFGIVIVAFIGIVISYVFSPIITPMIDEHIFHRQPHVTITLNQFEILEPTGFINVTQISDEFLWFNCEPYETCIITKDEIPGLFYLNVGDFDRVFGYMAEYEFSVPSSEVERGCVFSFPSKITYSPDKSAVFETWTPAKEIVELKNEGCKYADECLLGTFSANNFGNKKLSDFKAEVCLESEILYLEGDIDLFFNCLELREENFLPGDRLQGLFYGTPPFTALESYAYDEANGQFPDEHIVHMYSIVYPNCSY
jgi:hypothetical protein